MTAPWTLGYYKLGRSIDKWQTGPNRTSSHTREYAESAAPMLTCEAFLGFLLEWHYVELTGLRP